MDSLQIVNPTTMQNELKATLTRLGQRVAAEGATALVVPVVSIGDIDAALESRRQVINDDRQREGLPPKPPSLKPHIAYETFEPGMSIPATPGSEGPIGNLVRDFTGDRPGREQAGWVHPGTDVEGLRDGNCRYLVLVSDYSGSGQQICEFARTFVRNSRLRSWRSFGRFRIVVLTYAASWTARSRIDRDPHIDELIVCSPGKSFNDAQWTDIERSDIERICRQYTTRRTRKNALGYKDSAGLFLTHAAVPNNLPAILLRATRGWNSFLPNRVMPSDLAAELGTYEAPTRDLPSLAEEVRQLRLARAVGTRKYRSRADVIAITLALIAYEETTIPRLAHRMERTDAEITSVVEFLVETGFVTPGLALTSSGRTELHGAKWLQRKVAVPLTGSSDTYYPQALR